MIVLGHFCNSRPSFLRQNDATQPITRTTPTEKHFKQTAFAFGVSNCQYVFNTVFIKPFGNHHCFVLLLFS